MRLLYIKFAGSDYCYVYNFNGSKAEQYSRLNKFMNKMTMMGVVCSIIKGKKVYYVAVHNNYEDYLKQLGVVQTDISTSDQSQVIEDFYDDKGLLYGMNEVKVEKENFTEFEGGAKRGTDIDKAVRYDLISPVALRALAEVYAEGAVKYGADNWKKGIPMDNLLNHAINHIEMWRNGDKSEDHLQHALWNIFTMIHFERVK